MGGTAGRGRAGRGRLRCVATALACLLLVCGTAAAPAAAVPHSDAACGYRVGYPADWTAAPGKDGALVIDSPPALNTQVSILGIWDTSAVGAYSGPSTAARANGTVAQVLLDTDWEKSNHRLVWVDEFRIGLMSVSYITQLQQSDDGVWYYHLSILLISTGTARQLRPDGWSYAIVAAWIPRSRFQETEPIVMDVVRSIEFIRADKACWARAAPRTGRP